MANVVNVVHASQLCCHLVVEDYAFAQPSLVAHKRRKLELRAGRASARRRKGTASTGSRSNATCEQAATTA